MECLLQWIQQYGHTGLFILLVLGIVGIPLPDEILLTFVGHLVYRNEMQGGLIGTLAVAFAGSCCGITLSYILGRTLGHWLIVNYGPWVHITPERLQRVHNWFERYGRWTLVFGYYLPGIRHVTAYTAGMTEMRYKIFAGYAYCGAFIWCSTFILLGYILGPAWREVQEYLPRGSVMALGLLAAAVCLYLILLKLRRRRRKQEATAVCQE